MATLKYLSQYFSTTLNVGGGIDDSQTTGIILQSVSGVHDITEPGQICITYSDPVDTAVAEWIDYTSINGSNELVGAVRGREGFSAHAHLQGATVAFVLSASHHNDIVDQLNGTETGTTLTSPVINTGVTGTVLASAAEITTGTEPAKLVTPKELKDAGIVAVTASTDGWNAAGETWTYASASTITVPSGAASKYAKGDRIKFTQTTVKYAVIVGVADTVLTILVNTDYVVANAAITLNYYSHEINPIGYPHFFNIAAPTFNVTTGMDNGSGGQPTTTKHLAEVYGNTFHAVWYGTGTKTTTNFFITFGTANYPTPLNVDGSYGTPMGTSNIVWSSTNYCGLVLVLSSTNLQMMFDSDRTLADNQAFLSVGCSFIYQF